MMAEAISQVGTKVAIAEEKVQQQMQINAHLELKTQTLAQTIVNMERMIQPDSTKARGGWLIISSIFDSFLLIAFI